MRYRQDPSSRQHQARESFSDEVKAVVDTGWAFRAAAEFPPDKALTERDRPSGPGARVLTARPEGLNR